MSVRTGFTVVGAAIGYYFGGPQGAQLGAAIGGAVGGVVDPQIIKGPQIGDGAIQTSRAGIPIALVYGGPIPIVGTVVDQGPTNIITVKEQQGKGGPVTETERALKSFAILIGINGFTEPDGTPIPFTGVSRVKADGKLIYDVSTPPPAVGSDNFNDILRAFRESQTAAAKFLSKISFVLGGPDQMPHPTLESIHGVGNTPAYRGRALMIANQLDITDWGNRIPQFEIDMVTDGQSNATVQLDPLLFGGTTTPWIEGAPNVRDPRKNGVNYEYAFKENSSYTWNGAPGLVYYPTLAEAIAASGVDCEDNPTLVGWTHDSFGAYCASGLDSSAIMAPWDAGIADPNTVTELNLVLSRRDFAAEVNTYHANKSSGGASPPDTYPDEPTWCRRVEITAYNPFFPPTIAFNPSGVLKFSVDGSDDPGFDYYWSCAPLGNPLHVQYGDFAIICRAVPDCGQTTDGMFSVPDATQTYYDPVTRNIIILDTCNVVTGSWLQLQALTTHRPGSPAHLPSVIDTSPVGPTLISSDESNTQAYWEEQYGFAIAAGHMAPGLVWNVDYPVTVTEACECVPSVPIIEPDQVLLSDIQTSLCFRARIGPEKIDVSELTDGVWAFKIARSSTAANASRVLQQGFMYDAGEWDSKLRFPKRGGPNTFIITDDDLLDDDGFEELTREAGYELPRKFTVITYSLENHSTPVPQTSERYSPDVLSVSDPIVATMPIVMSANETRQVADRMKKIAITDFEGGLRIRVWQKFLTLCATDCGTINGKRYRIDRLNILDGIIEIEEARRDRQSAYSSDALGVNPPTPEGPISGQTIGPTMFAAMNLPYLRVQDNVPGMYVAARGVLAGWRSAQIELSKDGGISFTLQVIISVPSTMGYLTADLEAGNGTSAEPAYVNIFGSLSSVTPEQISNGFNLAAIIDADGVSELVQFETAIEGEDGQYEISGLTRGILGTADVLHLEGCQFVLLSAAEFIPIPIEYDGVTLVWRPVSTGTSPDANDTYETVYLPADLIIDGGEIT